MEIADALSKLSPEEEEEEEEAIPRMNVQVHDIYRQFSNSKPRQTQSSMC